MECDCARLTVYYEEPFWVGVYQREECGRLTVSKYTFGAEPRDYDVYRWLQDHWCDLEFSPPIESEPKPLFCRNPKRAQRVAAAATQDSGVGTKAQQALQLQYEQNKQARKKQRQERDEAETQRKFSIRCEKRKAKHRGH